MKTSSHIQLPKLSLGHKRLEFSALPIESDELTEAISNDIHERDDNWELSERPDMGELTKFWSEVEADVANDPEWFKMTAE